MFWDSNSSNNSDVLIELLSSIFKWATSFQPRAVVVIVVAVDGELLLLLPPLIVYLPLRRLPSFNKQVPTKEFCLD